MGNKLVKASQLQSVVTALNTKNATQDKSVVDLTNSTINSFTRTNQAVEDKVKFDGESVANVNFLSSEDMRIEKINNATIKADIKDEEISLDKIKNSKINLVFEVGGLTSLGLNNESNNFIRTQYVDVVSGSCLKLEAEKYNTRADIYYYDDMFNFLRKSETIVVPAKSKKSIEILDFTGNIKICLALNSLGDLTEEIISFLSASCTVYTPTFIRDIESKNKSLALKNIEMETVMKNLLGNYDEIVNINTVDLKSGLLKAADGIKVDSANWKYIVIKCKEGDKFSYSGVIENNIVSNAVFYKGTVFSSNNGRIDGSNLYNDEIITIPKDITKVGFTFYYPNENYNWLSIKKLNAFGQKNTFIEINKLSKSISSIDSSIYTTKKLAITGDSIETVSAGVWTGLLPLLIKFKSVSNSAVGGTRVTGQINSDERISKIPEDSDIVLLGGMTNDWAQNIPLGGLDTLSDYSTFCGGVDLLIQKVQLRCPNALIRYVSNPFGTCPNRDNFTNKTGILNNNGDSLKDFSDAIKKVCEHRGIHFIDVYSNCGINEYNHESFILQEQSGNNEVHLHPNQLGGKRIAEVVYNDFLNISKPLY